MTQLRQRRNGAPGGIRTHDPGIRNPVLYPAELRARPDGRISAATSQRQGFARRGFLSALAGGFALAGGRARADDPPVVHEVPGPDRLTLAGGTGVRLADILVPDSPGEGAAIAGQAKALLETLVLGHAVLLQPTGMDRYGTVRAEARVPAGLWLQGELVKAGLAWVWPDGDGDGVTSLLALEAGARSAGVGLWASATLGEQNAERLRSSAPRFAVILGRVRSVGKGRRWLYLNFGDDWRHDVTARIDPAEAKSFRAAGVDPATLAGRLVRIRGWLFSWDGPMIELARRAQLEIAG